MFAIKLNFCRAFNYKPETFHGPEWEVFDDISEEMFPTWEKTLNNLGLTVIDGEIRNGLHAVGFILDQQPG